MSENQEEMSPDDYNRGWARIGFSLLTMFIMIILWGKHYPVYIAFVVISWLLIIIVAYIARRMKRSRE